MNSDKIISQLRLQYPGKNIFSLPADNRTEIICEVEPSLNHPEYSLAIAIIDKSAPHFHCRSTETYKVLKGKLILIIEQKKISLKAGDKFIIKPGKVHAAIGKQTWVECISKPGWTRQDHILS